EASMLRLDCSKSRFRLGWTPRWSLEQALKATVEWTKAWASGGSSGDLRSLMLHQIDDYGG
ncbi:MAG: CDP-glucose 4,6-dehydratase, partial [Dethiosulfovibrio sp.]|nr:CDP-glucose 4,6-dehydratase [Dethiosulfovibrio sp.]